MTRGVNNCTIQATNNNIDIYSELVDLPSALSLPCDAEDGSMRAVLPSATPRPSSQKSLEGLHKSAADEY